MRNILFFLIILGSCTSKQQTEKSASPMTWYKGNTHVHTTLCGHADSHPDTVAGWYLDRGYNFLILSEHNQFIDPKSVNLPRNRRKDFILIPGEEVTDYKHVHTTAMNIDREVPVKYPTDLSKWKDAPAWNIKPFLMQIHSDSIRSVGGIPILNHPNWQSGVAASEIEQVKGLNMIELHNGHPDAYNFGNEKHASMEQKWDSLLTAGRRIYGVSSDDAHHFKKWGVDESNPGRGWVMVHSNDLTPDAITDAMIQGDFYASSGVMLSEIIVSEKGYEIHVDEEATYKETESPFVVGYKKDSGEEGFVIEYITDRGEIIMKKSSILAKVEIPEGINYMRGKVTYSRKRSSDYEQFFAWTQPIFLK